MTPFDPLQSALYLSSKGWPVFPVHGSVDGKCTCQKAACSSKGKHPVANGWQKVASTDEEDVRRAFKLPHSNIGMVTGRRSGIVVLDIDERNKGFESLTNLESKHGSLPQTVTVETGGGGRHFYFQYPEEEIGSRNNLTAGIDFKADGGYVVAPDSVHASGRRYRFADRLSPSEVSLHPLPVWLKSLLAKASNSDRARRDIPETIAKGRRNSDLMSVAGKLRHSGLEEREIAEALQVVNKRRCESPLDPCEVEDIARSASRYPIGTKKMKSTASLLRHWPSNPTQDAFWGLAGDIVRTIDPHTEADPMAVLVQFLAIFGNAIGRCAHWSVEADRHYTNVFAVMVGETSRARKGTSLSQVRRLFEDIDKTWTDRCWPTGLSSGEGLIHTLRDGNAGIQEDQF